MYVYGLIIMLTFIDSDKCIHIELAKKLLPSNLESTFIDFRL